VKKSASVQFKSQLVKLKKNGQITDIMAIFYLRAILEVCCNQNTDKDIAKYIAFTLHDLFSPAEEKTIEDFHKLLEQAVPILNEVLKNAAGDTVKLSGVIQCFNKILNIMMNHNNMHAAMGNIIENLQKNITGMCVKMRELVKAIDKEKVVELMMILELMIVWLDMCIDNYTISRHKETSLMYVCARSQELAAILAQCIQLIVPMEGQVPETLISYTNNTDLNEAINKMKENALRLTNLILGYIYLPNSALKSVETPYFALCEVIAPGSLITLLTICEKNYEELEGILKSRLISKIIVELLNFFYWMVEDNNYYKFFSEIKDRLIINIAFILIRTTAEEKVKLVEEPHEFVNIANDTCGNYSSNIPKTAAAKLINALCEHIDGTTSFVTHFCCEALLIAAKHSLLEEIKNNSVLGNYVDAKFLSSNTQEGIIETCLTVLSTIGDATYARVDLIFIIENTLAKIFSEILDNSTLLVKCRVALMLGYYIEILYPNDQNPFITLMEFLMKGLTAKTALSLQCADTLEEAMKSDKMIMRVSTFTGRLIPYLTATITKGNTTNCFSLFEVLITSLGSSIGAGIIKILAELVAKVDNEYKEFKAKGERNSGVMLNKCWNLINSICDNQEFYPHYAAIFENTLLPTFNYLADPLCIEFYDEILKIIDIFIKKSQTITLNLAKVFPMIPKVFESYESHKGVLGILLEILNSYLYFGKDLFKEHKHWIDLILKMAQSALFTQKEPKELHNAEGAILFQIVLQTLGGGILDAYIPNIIVELIKRLSMAPNGKLLTIQIYNSFLCAICNNALLALSIPIEQLESFIAGILDNQKFFEGTYNRKVLSIGLLNILIHGNAPELAKKYYTKILSTVIDTLQLQRLKEMKEQLKVSKKIIVNEDSESDSGEASDENNEMRDSEEK